MVVTAVALVPALVPGGLAGASGPARGFYLALGASESLGWQPGPHGGHPTDQGYANDLVAYEAAHGTRLTLTQLGCPGENTATMISGADRCYRSGGSQLGRAVAFLEAHRGERGLVTLDLGFNNVMSCMRDAAVRASCVRDHLAVVRVEFAYVVSTLSRAAGPGVTLVGLTHYDPLAAAGPSDDAITDLNRLESGVLARAGWRVAVVGPAFGTTVWARDHARDARAAAGTVCRLTWMCRRAANIHPDARGYRVIARAIERALAGVTPDSPPRAGGTVGGRRGPGSEGVSPTAASGRTAGGRVRARVRGGRRR